ncbi:ABC transporter permease [Saccharomonospora xinjiangensis]|uniref:ABC-type multidrug transport system, permease component n=1 Tax=Saccharomonospora xinjiangensis XJ-54 TaxID=882086 RepID=I0V5X6_9PSEU|nr:ABC transporter permease [Saccharomonospora xinjiangensis]EID55529.1 ABC-type multidrug transport system, permease component [Saccharomonospora xinjiangensis XJ-54]
MTSTLDHKRTVERGTIAPTPFRALSAAMFKGIVREKTTLFFTFLFPLMFLVIFGLLLNGQSDTRVTIAVVGEGPVITALEQTEAFDLESVGTAEEAEAQVRDGDLPAYVTQDGDTVRVRFAASTRETANLVLGVIDGVVNRTNVAVTGQEPRFSLDAEPVEDASMQPIQYLTPGILSWAVAMGAVFGAAITLVSWRRNQVLRRLRLAPVRAGTVLTSRLLVTLGVGAAQFVLFVSVALLPVFGLKLTGQWWLALPLLMLGTLAFFAVGMLVGAWCRTEESASTVANLVTVPMAFLSGAFFPVEAAPAWLQQVSWGLPMRHLNEGMLDVMVRGHGVEALLLPALVLLGFTVVIGALAAKLFRWEP